MIREVTGETEDVILAAVLRRWMETGKFHTPGERLKMSSDWEIAEQGDLRVRWLGKGGKSKDMESGKVVGQRQESWHSI